MKNLQKARLEEFNTILFSVKILALLFCAAPLFQYFFSDTSAGALENIDLNAIIVSLLIIIVITIMWIFVNKKQKDKMVGGIIEIVVFFSVCTASVCISGGMTSYYKFVFLFLVVAYTIEVSARAGMIISFTAMLLILTMDLIMYNEDGVNPYFQTDLALSAMFFAVVWIMGFYIKLESEHITRLESFVNKDGLTEVYNHRYFYDEMKRCCNAAETSGEQISLIMVDLDRFKLYNDMFGHQQGDYLLKELARLLQENLSKEDILCRYGGDEFVVITRNRKDKGLELADRLRKAVEEHYFTGAEHMPGGKITISVGIADQKNQSMNYIRMVSNADAALYKAKFMKRNHVEVYSSVLDSLDGKNHTFDEVIASVRSLISIINSRDDYTFNHTERVVWYCDAFAKHLNLTGSDRNNLLYSAYLHDVGKINVAKESLIKDSKLSDEQWEEMKKHPVYSADIVKQMEGLSQITDIVLHHHERYDGSGYPDGLKGEQINYFARMLTIADSFDAMTSVRPYQIARSIESAIAELERCKDTQFDGKLVDEFVSIIKKKALI